MLITGEAGAIHGPPCPRPAARPLPKGLAPLRWRHAGDRIYEQGDPCIGIYQVRSGVVGLRAGNESGKHMLVALAHAGDFFGYADFLEQREHRLGAEMLESGRLAFIGGARLRKMLEDERDFLVCLMLQASRDLSRAQEKLLGQNARHAAARLAEFFLTYSNVPPGADSDSTCDFLLPLRHRDVADFLGLRPETLSRTVTALHAAGIVTWRQHDVHILDRIRLAAVAAQ